MVLVRFVRSDPNCSGAPSSLLRGEYLIKSICLFQPSPCGILKQETGVSEGTLLLPGKDIQLSPKRRKITR
jgi:hypothetical protein